VEEGRVEGERLGALREARKLLRRLGAATCGPPDEQTAAAIEQIDDLTRLEDLCAQASSAASWQELLGQPTGSPQRGRRRRSP